MNFFIIFFNLPSGRLIFKVLFFYMSLSSVCVFSIRKLRELLAKIYISALAA